MSIKTRKVWVARDLDNQLRLYTRKPYWMERENIGFWTSKAPNWQINYEEFLDIGKGEVELVKMTYQLNMLFKSNR